MGIIEKYSFLKPFIGEDFEVSIPKILFIGESHYVDNDGEKSDYNVIVKELNLNGDNKKKEEMFSEFWYQSDEKKLLDDLKLRSIHWFNTSGLVREVIEKYSRNMSAGREKRIYWLPAKILNQANGIPEFNDKITISRTMESFSFINYYARPSLFKGESIHNTNRDNEEAYNYLLEVFEEYKPRHLIFLSRRAYNTFNDTNKSRQCFDSKIILNLSHPAYFKEWGEQGKCYKELLDFYKKSGSCQISK